VRVPVDDLFLVDEVEWVGERRQESAGGEFQAKDDCPWSSGISILSIQLAVVAGACAGDALRREKRCGSRLAPTSCAVSGDPSWNFDARKDLERVGLAAIGRLRHLGAEVADEIVR